MSLSNRQKHPLVKRGWTRALLLFIVYLAGSVLVAFALGVYAARVKQDVNTESYYVIAASSLLSILAVFIFRKYVDRRTFASIGLSFHHFYPGGVIGFLIGLFLVCIGGVIIYFLGGLQWTDILFSNNIFTSVCILLLVAFSEELVFRGYILRNLMKSFNSWLSLSISALLFALVHLMNPGIPVVGVINIILGGLLLGITFINTRNLWMPVLFHFSWNFFQGPVLGFPVSGVPFKTLLSATISGNELISGGSFGFEGSIICTVVLLAAFLAFVFSKRFS